MALFDLVFFLLVMNFLVVIVFVVKVFSRINRSVFERYKYMGPFVLVIPGALDRLGRIYLLVVAFLVLMFLAGFAFLSSGLESG